MTQLDSSNDGIEIQSANVIDLLTNAIAMLTENEIHIAAAHVQHALDYLLEREIAGS